MINKSDFPKKLYVYIDEDGDEKFFIAEETDQDCASLSEDKLIGIYNLEKVGKLLHATSVMVAV